jgi:hypothetical protein
MQLGGLGQLKNPMTSSGIEVEVSSRYSIVPAEIIDFLAYIGYVLHSPQCLCASSKL